MGYSLNKTDNKKVTNEELSSFEYMISSKDQKIIRIKEGKINKIGIKIEELVDKITNKFLN